jgi:hypothetical protein
VAPTGSGLLDEHDQFVCATRHILPKLHELADLSSTAITEVDVDWPAAHHETQDRFSRLEWMPRLHFNRAWADNDRAAAIDLLRLMLRLYRFAIRSEYRRVGSRLELLCPFLVRRLLALLPQLLASGLFTAEDWELILTELPSDRELVSRAQRQQLIHMHFGIDRLRDGVVDSYRERNQGNVTDFYSGRLNVTDLVKKQVSATRESLVNEGRPASEWKIPAAVAARQIEREPLPWEKKYVYVIMNRADVQWFRLRNAMFGGGMERFIWIAGEHRAPSRMYSIRAAFSLARAAIACRIYELRYGHLPSDVNVLVEAAILPEVPLDPMDGEPIRYKPEDRKLWSIGYDLVDNGGERTPMQGEPDLVLSY